MREFDDKNIIAYLKETGRLDQSDQAQAAALAWGVSNVVLRICPELREDFVVKQSRAQLRTSAEWFSRLDRIFREKSFMEVVSPLLPPGTVPQVLFEDQDNYLFGMEAIDADHIVWKQSLLAGEFDPQISETLGKYLATIHAKTAGSDELLERWNCLEVFDELRVDPFYRRIAAVHPDLRPAIDRLIDEILHNRICAVHADFSPKNILITADGISLVDFETGHYGDPAFDLGFFLSHLLLKAVKFADRCEEFFPLPSTFWTSYLQQLGQQVFEVADLERRAIENLAACMLSRIDGKSTVDYLPETKQQNLVRDYCHQLFLDPPQTIPECFDILKSKLA